MPPVEIHLSNETREWVERQATDRGFADADAFVSHLLEEARLRAETVQELERALIEGIDSGPSTPMTKEDWAEIRAEGRRMIQERRRA